MIKLARDCQFRVNMRIIYLARRKNIQGEYFVWDHKNHRRFVILYPDGIYKTNTLSGIIKLAKKFNLACSSVDRLANWQFNFYIPGKGIWNLILLINLCVAPGR
jgi:hypothetical protein